jgi:hypothetical protein
LSYFVDLFAGDKDEIASELADSLLRFLFGGKLQLQYHRKNNNNQTVIESIPLPTKPGTQYCITYDF